MSSGNAGRHRRDTAPTVAIRGDKHAPPSRAGTDRSAVDRLAHERGSCVGRYVILEHLHSGGMGAVYRAFDPDLNRPVALKLVSARHEGDREDVFRDRLLREAQGLARLSHPNVVAIYDVGIIEGDVFLAMELIEGRTLRRWLDRQPRRREILDVFAAAADGLAAAHRADLVHRDVKPDNILIGDDGRVRVVDFGLVRPVDDPLLDELPPPALTTTESGERSSDPMFSQLTEVGAVIGTPSYMAPEQFNGGDVGPAADQFGLCVSLYEALCGQLPFEGGSVDALRRNIGAGRFTSPPAEARVSPRLRRLLARGLSVMPASRFGSMTELAAQLRRDPAARWRRRAVLAAAACALAGAGALAARAPAVAVCAQTERANERVWTASARAAAQAGFAATGRRHADTTFARVDEGLVAFERAWAAERQDACEATHVRGEQSAQLLDLRMRCLDEARERVAALVALFAARPDDELVDRAAAATSELSSLARCRSAEVLTAAVAPPEAAAARAEADQIASLLARAEAFYAAGKFSDALPLAQDAVARARAIDHPPSLAAAMLRLASLEDGAGHYEQAVATLEAALPVAARARQPSVVAELWTSLVFVNGVRLRRFERALSFEQPASVAVELAGGQPRLRARLDDRVGAVHLYAGDLERARKRFLTSLANKQRTPGTKALELAEARNNLGASLVRLREHAEAQAHLERTLAVYERELGPTHPRTSSVLYNLGFVSSEQGEQERAASLVERALAIEEASLGPRHPALAPTLGLLGRIATRRGRDGEAIRLIGRALDIIETELGPEDPYAMTAHDELGRVLMREARFDEAEAHLRRALAMAEASSKVGGPRAARIRLRLADVAAARGDCKAALALYRPGPSASEQPWSTIGVAECALRQGHSPDQRALAAALSGLDAGVAFAELRGRAELAIARAAAARGDNARAAEHAGRAARELESVGDRAAADAARRLERRN